MRRSSQLITINRGYAIREIMAQKTPRTGTNVILHDSPIQETNFSIPVLSLSILIFHQKTPVNQEFPRKGGRAEPNEVQACYPRERLTGSCRVSFDSSVPVHFAC